MSKAGLENTKLIFLGAQQSLNVHIFLFNANDKLQTSGQICNLAALSFGRLGFIHGPNLNP